MTWPPSKLLVCSSGTSSAGRQGEKRPWWLRERRCLLFPPRDARRWQSGRAVATATSLISTIPCRFWQTCQASRATGIERIDPFVLVFCWGGLFQTGWEKKDGVRQGRQEAKRQIAPESKRDQQPPFCSSRCVINVTLQVESFGNFLCQQALGRAAGFAGWQRAPSSGTCDVLARSISVTHSPQHEPSSSTIPRITSNKQHLQSALVEPGREYHFCHRKCPICVLFLRSLESESWRGCLHVELHALFEPQMFVEGPRLHLGREKKETKQIVFVFSHFCGYGNLWKAPLVFKLLQ